MTLLCLDFPEYHAQRVAVWLSHRLVRAHTRGMATHAVMTRTNRPTHNKLSKVSTDVRRGGRGWRSD